MVENVSLTADDVGMDTIVSVAGVGVVIEVD